MVDVKDLVTSRIPAVLQEYHRQSDRSPLSPRRCLEALNDAYRLLCREAEHKGKGEILEFINTRVEDRSTGLLDQRIPMRVSKRVSLALSNGQEWPSVRERNAMHYRAFHGIPQGDAMTASYRVQRDRLYVLNDSYSHFRLWFTARSPALHYGKVQDTQPSSTTELHLSTNPENGPFDHTRGIYLNQLVFIYDGPGAGQTARISGQNYNVVTLSPIDGEENALSVPITPDSHYCIVPWFVDFVDLLVRLAAKQFTKIETAVTLFDETSKGMSQFMDWLTPEDMATQEPIPNQGTDDYGLGGGFIGSGGF